MRVGQQKDIGSNQSRDQGQGQGGPMGGAEGSVVSGSGVGGGGGGGGGIEGGIGGGGSIDRSTSDVELRSNETPTGPSEVTPLDTVSHIYYPSN